MDVLARHNINVTGRTDAQPMLFAHGFGCDQNMWRDVAPNFSDDFRVILLDHVGAGGSDLAAYDAEKYASLDGYAADVVEIYRQLDLRNVIVVGHSVSAMIGVLAARSEPDRFDKLVLVGPSPRHLDDDSYRGGFSASDIAELLESLESNYLGWSSAMAPVIMGNPDRPDLAAELTDSFCRTDPDIARRFARVTFLRQSRRPSAGDHPHAGTAVLSGCDRATCGRGVCARCHTESHSGHAERDRPLPQLERAG